MKLTTALTRSLVVTGLLFSAQSFAQDVNVSDVAGQRAKGVQGCAQSHVSCDMVNDKAPKRQVKKVNKAPKSQAAKNKNKKIKQTKRVNESTRSAVNADMNQMPYVKQ